MSNPSALPRAPNANRPPAQMSADPHDTRLAQLAALLPLAGGDTAPTRFMLCLLLDLPPGQRRALCMAILADTDVSHAPDGWCAIEMARLELELAALRGAVGVEVLP